MASRFIGGILLIVGTSIGGGMLALPVANAASGFWASSVFLLICWAAMTLGAFLILEANLYLPIGSNMVSMARATLGIGGAMVTWVTYLILLYTLLSAYISGGADVLGSLLFSSGLHLSATQNSILFTLFFGAIVYSGIRQVDWSNRALMFGKLGAYLLLVLLISPRVELSHFHSGHYQYIAGTLMILMTSFGFAIIIPSLREYFNDNIPMLRRAILIGSLIPLVCYIAWDAVIMGSLPTGGEHGLASLMHSEHTTSDLAKLLSDTLQQGLISGLFNFFIAISMLTAFLGVSLCLISFLADGLSIEQKGKSGFVLFLLTFLPPLLVVLTYPGIYIHALDYAGSFCILLLLLLPALMIIAGRKKFARTYQVSGGMAVPWIVLLFALLALTNALLQFLR
ncbi:MAG: tryptophan/tyrosine permease [Legionellaceae bacterium]|nr:tryptophan/tyrosine permease [Legionellaceae bacterium]